MKKKKKKKKKKKNSFIFYFFIMFVPGFFIHRCHILPNLTAYSVFVHVHVHYINYAGHNISYNQAPRL